MSTAVKTAMKTAMKTAGPVRPMQVRRGMSDDDVRDPAPYVRPTRAACGGRWRRAYLVLAAVLGGAAGPVACGPDRPAAPPTELAPPRPPVAVIVVSGPDSLEVGQTGSLVVYLRDARGEVVRDVLPERVVVSDSAVAQLVHLGNTGYEVRGGAPGTVTITASGYGVAGTLTVRVMPVPPNALPAPVAPVPGVRAWTAVEAGLEHTCGLTDVGDVYCWGMNARGQVTGTPNEPPAAFAPVRVALPTVARQLAVGLDHSCAVGTDGAVYCWGRNDFFKLGAPPPRPPPSPFDPWGARLWRVAVSAPFVSASAGPYHTCAVTTGGVVYCWGLDEDGELGAPRPTELCPVSLCRATPVAVQGVQGGARFASVAAGARHTCGLTPDGSAYCWGGIGLGVAPTERLADTCVSSQPVGRGQTPVTWPCTRTPLPVAGGLLLTTLSARNVATCGVTTDDVLACWSGAGMPERLPSAERFRAVSTQGGAACGITTADQVFCWGTNRWGLLGAATPDSSATPVPLPAPAGAARAVSVGGTHACGVTRDGRAVFCWGNPRNGRLGRGP